MRCLLPTVVADVSPGDLDALYAWPDQPWVRSNMVESLDGAAHSPNGGTRSLSSAADRRILGVVRALADAIIVGAGTARLEGYAALRPRPAYVDRRAQANQQPTPTMVVVSRSLDLDPAAPLFDMEGARTLVVTTESASREAMDSLSAVADVVTCGRAEVDLTMMRELLIERGLTRLVVEGGPSLLGAMLNAGLVDDMAVTIAPLVVGDYESGPARRIVTGSLSAGAVSLSLAHLIEEDGALFARYEVLR